MPLPDDLLSLARHLVKRNPGTPIEADLRRGVSTAYYALFHLLISESTTRIIALVAMRPRVTRAFDHKDMRKICQVYSAHVAPSAPPIPPEIQTIALTFVTLQDARHQADYDTAITMTYLEANGYVQEAEIAFAAWATVQTNPAVDPFLTDLLFQSIRKR